MDILLKAIICCVICLVICSVLGGKQRDFTALLCIFVCCGIAILAMSYLKPVFQFFEKLDKLGNINLEMVKTLIKVTGIGILAEIGSLICKDMGSSTLAKGLELLGSALILWLSLPIFSELLSLIENLLGAI